MSGDKKTYKIRFEDVSVAEAGQKVAGLRQDLLDASPDVSVETLKDDPTTQDFGATLVLVLGAPTVVLIAKGIADYLSRVGGTVRIEGEDGTVLLRNVSGRDASRIIEAISALSDS